MNDKNKPDIESMLHTIKDIQSNDSLSQLSDALFDHHYAKQQEKFAKKTKREWTAVKTLLSPVTYPVTWMTQTNMRRATAICLVLLMLIVGYVSSPPERNVLAATIKALQAVQSMKIQFSSTTGNQIQRETILWQHPLRMKVEQFKTDDQINKTFWIDDSNITIVNHWDKTYHQRELKDGETLYGVDGNRWITNATSPMQIVISYIDFIHQNWNTVSARQSQVNTSNPVTSYRFDYGDGRTTELTIDSNTELPLYLHFIYPANPKREREDTTIQFDWNLALSDIDFNPIIPLDFSIKSVEELKLDEIPSISYPGGAHTVRYDMNPSSDPPTTMATVSGSVVDEDSKPIAYATVGIKDGPTARTDTSGQFHFQFDYTSVTSPSQYFFYLECIADGYAQSIIVLQIDQYSPNANPHFILRPGTSISGKVVDENNQPVAGANVIANYHSPDANTNQNGEFTFMGLGIYSEEFDIFVNKEGYHSGRTVSIRHLQPQPYYELESNTITLSKQQELSRIIQVIDTDLNPIAGASIQLQNSEETYVTGEDGRIELKGYLQETDAQPTNQTKHIIVSKDGFAYQSSDVNLLVNHPHTIILIPGNTMDIKIIDNEGNPVPGVQFYYTYQARNFMYFSDMKLKSDLSDESGLIELTNLNNEQSIEYRLTFPTDSPYTNHGERYSYTSIDPSKYQNEPFVITVDRADAVEGNIYYEGTDEPVPFFTIKFTRDFDNEYPKGKFLKGSGDMTVYKSTSGYFRSEFVTDPLRGYKDIIRVRVKEGFGNLVPNAIVHVFTYSLNEIKDGPLRIEIPRANE